MTNSMTEIPKVGGQLLVQLAAVPLCVQQHGQVWGSICHLLTLQCPCMYNSMDRCGEAYATFSPSIALVCTIAWTGVGKHMPPSHPAVSLYVQQHNRCGVVYAIFSPSQTQTRNAKKLKGSFFCCHGSRYRCGEMVAHATFSPNGGKMSNS